MLFCFGYRRLQDLPDTGAELCCAELFLIGIYRFHYAHLDMVRPSGEEEKFPWGEQPVGIVYAKDMYRGPAIPGDFASARIEYADFPVPSAGTLWKDKEITSVFEIVSHRLHLLQQDTGKRSAGYGGEIAGFSENPAENGHGKKDGFDNGLGLLQQ